MAIKSPKRTVHKGRQEGGSFSALPHAVQESENWAKCSPLSIKLLMDLLSQFRGSNNGDLSTGMGVMKKKGWTRTSSITRAARELVHFGMIEQTKQGGLFNKKPNLYAVTFKSIDDCDGKLDIKATKVASGLWKQSKPVFKSSDKKLRNAKCSEAKRGAFP